MTVSIDGQRLGSSLMAMAIRLHRERRPPPPGAQRGGRRRAIRGIPRLSWAPWWMKRTVGACLTMLPRAARTSPGNDPDESLHALAEYTELKTVWMALAP